MLQESRISLQGWKLRPTLAPPQHDPGDKEPILAHSDLSPCSSNHHPTARAKAALSITIIIRVIIIINIIVMVFPEEALNSSRRDKGKLVASSGSHNGTGPSSVCVYSLPMYVREKKRER